MIPNSVIEMRDIAMNDESYTQRCVMGEKVFYVEAEKAYVPGHIYSPLGRDEFFISKLCEYHFDEWTIEPEDDLDGEPPF